MKSPSRYFGALIAICSCLDIALSAVVMRLQYRQASHIEGDAIVGSVRMPVGYTAARQFTDLSAKSDRCIAIRTTSARCPFCSAGEAEWRSFEVDLRNSGCAVFSIAPSLADAARPGDPADLGAAELVFLDPEWINRMQLRAEPTVMIFGPPSAAGRPLLWRATGRLDVSRTARARALLQQHHGRR